VDPRSEDIRQAAGWIAIDPIRILLDGPMDRIDRTTAHKGIHVLSFANPPDPEMGSAAQLISIQHPQRQILHRASLED